MRYFLDEDMLAVAKALGAVRDDVCYPGHPNLLDVPTGTLDEDWLPVIGRAGRDLVLITRDRKIRSTCRGTPDGSGSVRTVRPGAAAGSRRRARRRRTR